MPLLLLLERYWKPAGLLVILLATFYAGYHTRGAFDQVTADKLLQHQIELNEEAQDKINTKAKLLEINLAAERTKSSSLETRWRKINAQKHTACNLSDDTISILHDATSNNDAPAK